MLTKSPIQPKALRQSQFVPITKAIRELQTNKISISEIMLMLRQLDARYRDIRGGAEEIIGAIRQMDARYKGLKDITASVSSKAREALLAALSAKEHATIAETALARVPKGDPGTPGIDGKDADEETIVQRVLDQIEISLPEAVDYDRITKEVVAQVIAEVAAQSLKKKVSIADIPGLEDRLRRVTNMARDGFVRGGGDTVAAGTNVTITSSGGVKTISSTGGSGFSILTATGTVDDSNVTFTFISQPTLLCINGAFYQSSGGAITWSYVTGTVTLSSPVGTGGSIFGIA